MLKMLSIRLLIISAISCLISINTASAQTSYSGENANSVYYDAPSNHLINNTSLIYKCQDENTDQDNGSSDQATDGSTDQSTDQSTDNSNDQGETTYQ